MTIFKKKKGFTLIELMVVISIAAVLGTFGIAGFANYNQTQVLQSSASEVVAMLSLARSRAQSQIKPSACSGDLNGYWVVILSPRTYTLKASCSGPPDSVLDLAIGSPKYLQAGLSFDADRSVFFPVQIGGVQTPGQITITDKSNKYKIITINSVGGLSMGLGSTIFPTATPTSAPFPTSTPVPTSTPTPTPAPTPTPLPTPTPTPTPTKKVFVTNQSYSGNLDSLSGANNICQGLANTAGIGNTVGKTYKAWLSDTYTSAATNISPSSTTTPYVLTDNTTRVADNWNGVNGLTQGTLLHAINKGERGEIRDGYIVWTNTYFDGNIYYTNLGYNCNGWTFSGSGFGGAGGSSSATDPTWTYSGVYGCPSVGALYCIQQ